MECLEALALLDEMLSRIQDTPPGEEKGFVACTKDGQLLLGATCDDDGFNCTLREKPCKEGEPVFSFHTHTTKVTLVAALAGNDEMFSRAERLALMPSSKDVNADRQLGVAYGCVGGQRSDESAAIVCFPRRDVTDETVEKVARITGAARKIVPGVTDNTIPDLLDEYFEAVGRPCLDMHVRLDHRHTVTAKCAVCEARKTQAVRA